MATPKENEKPPLTIILTGKSGAGKSTLRDILFKTGAVQKPSPVSVTNKFVDDEFTKNGIKIRLIDTPGLKGNIEDQKELKMCSAYTKGKADLLVYCIPVGAGHKFHDNNPLIMLYLTEGFGKQIWEHCILVFTMSNLAMRDFNDDHPEDPEKAAEEYRELLKEYADLFQKQLKALGVRRKVKTILELEETEDIADTIVAVPAGKREGDKVLPGLKRKLSDRCDGTWVSVMAESMQASTTPGNAEQILSYQYGSNTGLAIAALLGTGATGALGGAYMGAAAGATAAAGSTMTLSASLGPLVASTIVSPPVGLAIGGSMIGGIVGTYVGALYASRHDPEHEKANIKQEVEDRQKKEQKETAERKSEQEGGQSSN